MPSEPPSPYHDRRRVSDAVARGNHRGVIGGKWEEIGGLQFAFLRDAGLTPDMRLIDIGCGCLRAGVHLVRYLDPGNYYGIDLSEELLEAGYEKELRPLGLDARLPRSNLACIDDFDASGFGVRFDMALAQSVFTHLPRSYLADCLAKAGNYVRDGGSLHLSFFFAPDTRWSQPVRQVPTGVTTHPDRNPYHYRESDLADCAEGTPWRLERIGDWNHPRGQFIASYRRLGG